MSECTLGETAMTKYQYPDDVEAAMDQFAADNPNAGWRAIVRAFERSMIQSMREGGSLFKEFDPYDGAR